MYCLAGFLLNAARSFAIGFQWFKVRHRKEITLTHRPGLVADVLVAVIY
jgi:hypothetical protein